MQELEADIVRRETEIKSSGNAGLQEGWKLNERGEVRFSLSVHLLVLTGARRYSTRRVYRSSTFARNSVRSPRPRRRSRACQWPRSPSRRLTCGTSSKRMESRSSVSSFPTGTREPMLTHAFAGPLNVPLPASSTPDQAPNPPPTPSSGLSLATQALIDEIEKEDAATEAGARAESQEEDAALGTPENAPVVTSAPSKLVEPSAPAAPKQKPSAKESLPGFSSGFLGRPKSTKPKTPTPSATAKTSTPNFSSAPSPSASITSHEPVVHQPLHHILPPSKSIYRPTPPPSAPSSRPNSPRPDRRVAFDVPTEPETKSPKAKRAAIPLPPPPSHDDFPQEFSSDPPPPPPTLKVPFQRPIKETVVERPVRPPTVPKPRVAQVPAKKEDGAPLLTLGRSPKPAVAATFIRPSAGPPQPRGSTPVATPAAAPIHTLSFSQNPAFAPKDGQASIHELVPEDIEYDDDMDEERPSLTSDGESDSSGFYGNSEDEDDEEIDIDGALHAREVALEYHRQRMNLGAGAGTGPLGGDLEPDAYDSWNQPVRLLSSPLSCSTNASLCAERPRRSYPTRSRPRRRPLLALPHRSPRIGSDDHSFASRPTRSRGRARFRGRGRRPHARGAGKHPQDARDARGEDGRRWTCDAGWEKDRPGFEWVDLPDAGSYTGGEGGQGQGTASCQGGWSADRGAGEPDAGGARGAAGAFGGAEEDVEVRPVLRPPSAAS